MKLSCFMIAILLATYIKITNAGVVPKWTPTYSMPMSTIFMPCNYSGYFDPHYSAQWGIADFDWGNTYDLWVASTPMNCEERLIEQAKMTKAVNSNTKVMIYRNLVKALPWFTSVREKITDPAYEGWFVKFAKGVTPHVPTENTTYYHDHEHRTPEYPKYCKKPCPCGEIACGEYIWDHRNQSLRNWLVYDFVLGETGLGNPHVDGFFLDDFWRGVHGPSEFDPNVLHDIGFTDADANEMTTEWQKTLDLVNDETVKRGGFNWRQLDVARAKMSATEAKQQCASFLKQHCVPNAPILDQAILFEFAEGKPLDSLALPTFQQDLAEFLLVRGPYAWLGYYWSGCSSGTVPGGFNGPYVRPAALDIDYGTPTETCYETHAGSGVFQRKWTKAMVSVDCNTFIGNITML